MGDIVSCSFHMLSSRQRISPRVWMQLRKTHRIFCSLVETWRRISVIVIFVISYTSLRFGENKEKLKNILTCLSYNLEKTLKTL